MYIQDDDLKKIEHALRDNLKAAMYKNEEILYDALKIVERVITDESPEEKAHKQQDLELRLNKLIETWKDNNDTGDAGHDCAIDNCISDLEDLILDRK